MSMMDGYKTYIAAFLMIATGLAQMVGVAPEIMAYTDPNGWALVVAGFGLLGIGHKLEKMVIVSQPAKPTPIGQPGPAEGKE